MDLAIFMKCVNFAAEKHKNQRRKDTEKTPYINHPIGKAYHLSRIQVFHNLNFLSVNKL